MTNEPHILRPDPVRNPAGNSYYELVQKLSTLLPPPSDDSPESLLARNHAAIGKVAAMQPANSDEADIAAHCVAARARAEEALLEIRQHTGDPADLIRLSAQFALMERTAIATRSLLLRLQTARQKRDKIAEDAGGASWMEHVALRQMQVALGADPPDPVEEQPPEALPEPSAEPPPAEPIPADELRRTVASGRIPSGLTVELLAEAECYAITYPARARLIREHGGVPKGCNFGPPARALVRAIIAGATPALRALDATAA